MRQPAIPQVNVPDVNDPATSRALQALTEAVRSLQSRSLPSVVVADLQVGRNAVVHRLGRPPVFVAVQVAVSGFGYTVVADNPHPDRQVLIDVTGVAQPGSAVLVI